MRNVNREGFFGNQKIPGSIDIERKGPLAQRELPRQHQLFALQVTQRAERLGQMTRGLQDALTRLENLVAVVLDHDASDHDARKAAEAYFEESDKIEQILQTLEGREHPTVYAQPELGATRMSIEDQLTQRLEQVSNWRELYDALQETIGDGVVRGSASNYSLDQIVLLIANAKNDPAQLDRLTNAGSIYDTVTRLLGVDASAPTEVHPERESLSQGDQLLRKFVQFTISQSERIQNELNSGKPLSDIIYDDFYASLPEPRYSNSVERKQMQVTYERGAKKAKQQLMQMYQDGKKTGDGSLTPSGVMFQGEWVYFIANKGMSPEKNVNKGRVYVNIDPQYAPQFYQQLMGQCAAEGVNMEAKMSATAGEEELHRPEMITMYFDEDQSQEILAVLDVLHQKYAAVMQPNIAPATAQMRNVAGQEMSGLSFGQEPPHSIGSFGETRSAALADFYQAVQPKGIPPFSDRARNIFRQICQSRRIDPENPAFNASDTGSTFSAIRQRLAE